MKYNATCSNPDCGREFQVDYKPTPGREIYCGACFLKMKSGQNAVEGELKKLQSTLLKEESSLEEIDQALTKKLKELLGQPSPDPETRRAIQTILNKLIADKERQKNILEDLTKLKK